MTSTKKHTVTAALPYANGPIHIGHLAGCYLPADIYVRYLRKQGKDVVFICGSDEHGVPITIKAKKEGITPQQLVDKNHAQIKKSFEDFGIGFDIYSRTSSKMHHETASDFFKTLYNKNVFTEETTEQYYDEEAKQFLADRYITGTCPKCNNEGAYGDQCEKCGSSLNPTDLINPRSALSGNPPVLRNTKNWFLPLDTIQNNFLNNFIASKTNWRSNVLGQCQSWLNEGLKPRAMTRDLDWGVKVPVDGADGKVLYVWFDAPIGYISNTKELKPDNWHEYWDANAEITHFIGKDNIVFHCIIFPAMLHLHGGFGLPANVPANEFLNLEGNKISTSRNWAIWLHEYLQDLPGKQDELRYVLTSIAPETKDSEFTWKDYQARVNNELVAIFGNFVNRAVVLSHKYFNGVLHAPSNNNPADTSLFAELQNCKNRMHSHLDNFRFREAQQELMNMARAGNKYLADLEPWHLYKTNPERVGEILTAAANTCLLLAEACEFFLPHTASKLYSLLNTQNNQPLRNGHQINQPILLFQKLEDNVIEQMSQKLQQSAPTPITVSSKTNTTLKPEIAFDDFSKMDLKVGTIVQAHKLENADKLLQFVVDLGFETRTIVSGIAQHYSPEKTIGKKVLVLCNLAPRKIKGIESKGMILLAENSNGKLVFMSPENDVDNGSNVS